MATDSWTVLNGVARDSWTVLNGVARDSWTVLKWCGYRQSDSVEMMWLETVGQR